MLLQAKNKEVLKNTENFGMRLNTWLKQEMVVNWVNMNKIIWNSIQFRWWWFAIKYTMKISCSDNNY